MSRMPCVPAEWKPWRYQGNTNNWAFSLFPMFLAALQKALSHLALSQVADKPRQDIKKQRHPLPRKVRIVKAMAFPVATYGCESWTIKKAEHQRIDAFELWWWRRLLRICWTARRSNQSIWKEINLEYSLEGLMLKLKLQYFDHLTHWERP